MNIYMKELHIMLRSSRWYWRSTGSGGILYMRELHISSEVVDSTGAALEAAGFYT